MPGSEASHRPFQNGDRAVIAALLNGDEMAFESLVHDYYAPMLRLALVYVSDRRLAEEAIQDTWIGVLRGLPKFEGRSSLKTWVFSILVNKAKTAAQREGRYVPLEWNDDAESDGPTVPPERFFSADSETKPNHWLFAPQSWESIPETRLLSTETREIIEQAIDALPANQRLVITLRDIDQWSSDEVCNALGITESNQRVLLHRARSKVRGVLEKYLES
jgi:RNA polymerase sigma-70 factor (ECF subfamily)